MTMASSPLLDLPAELIDWTLDYVSVEDLVNTALTCRLMLKHLEGPTQRHRNYHNIYRLQHDRIPSTIPQLLRLALSQPEVTSHIRT
jgi:hypothetical protein